MKKIKYWMFAFMVSVTLASCSNEVEEPQQEGNPAMQIENQFANVHFGDILPFEATVNDDVPLSTLTAILYFGEEEVSKTTIRTKENGQYSGSIAVPFGKNIPDGTATLEFILVNTTMKKTTQTFDVPVTRAQYSYIILVTAEASYPMLPTGEPNEYAATEAFPSTELPAYIQTPVVDDKGREILFGWDEEQGGIAEGTSADIPFASPVGGTYSVTFNTRTFTASPFFEVVLNGQKMNMADKDNYQLDIDLTQGEEVTLEGLTDWWVDPDFFAEDGDKMTFVPISGKYRVTANLPFNYLKVEALIGSNLATLQPDGTGALWIIGDQVGKPSYTANHVGWNPPNALCMAPVGNKTYQVTLVAGETVNASEINFKFFHQKDWGGEFGSQTLTTESDIVFVGNGTNGRDNGNLGLVEGTTLEVGATYVFTVDLSAGNDNAVLTVVKE
ncbi:DUF5121 domain-containing protein [uncultured Proteiniphilum sp.]|uniref:DUF5121 domain-containing protein n=1 Tax=uncultured Proteiniphilum sp. TaxID=497637 RepID=UPI002601CF00|nr:DUF5121 domain-containing protein [uncultured Proteiniphilum sp.]